MAMPAYRLSRRLKPWRHGNSRLAFVVSATFAGPLLYGAGP